MTSELNARRLAVVERAFQKFDRDGSGVIELVDLKHTYDVSRHPRVLDGTMSESMVKTMFLNNFESAESRDGKITWDEFVQYYSRMSREVDRSREVDHDAYFELMVIRAWRLDEDPEQALPGTKIQPLTLDVPKGFQASRNMDLVFPDAEAGSVLLGYKAVVKPLFARRDLPQSLRGYFALAEESERARVKHVPLPAALLKKLDIVWQDESTGEWVGFEGIVSSNVKSGETLPADLANALVSAEQSQALGVRYLPLAKPFNPVFKRTSDCYGQDAESQAQEVLKLKKAVYDGTNCGHVFAGRTGKFTNNFAGGAYRSSGLNTSATHSKVIDQHY